MLLGQMNRQKNQGKFNKQAIDFPLVIRKDL